jgi:hypothetical protein
VPPFVSIQHFKADVMKELLPLPCSQVFDVFFKAEGSNDGPAMIQKRL